MQKLWAEVKKTVPGTVVAARKARSPMVDSRVRPTIRDEDEDFSDFGICHLTKFVDEVRRCRPM